MRIGLLLSITAEIGFVAGASFVPALIVRDAAMGACRAGAACSSLAGYGMVMGACLSAMVLVSAFLLPGIHSGLMSRKRWAPPAEYAAQDAVRAAFWTYANALFAVGFVVAAFRVGKLYAAG